MEALLEASLGDLAYGFEHDGDSQRSSDDNDLRRRRVVREEFQPRGETEVYHGPTDGEEQRPHVEQVRAPENDTGSDEDSHGKEDESKFSMHEDQRHAE